MPAPIPRRTFLVFLAAMAQVHLRSAQREKSPYQPGFLHPNDRWVALRGDKGHLFEVMDLESGKSVRTLAESRCDTYYGEPHLFFDPSGRYLLMLYNGHHDYFLRRWDLQDGTGPLNLDVDLVRKLHAENAALGMGTSGEYGIPSFNLPTPGNILRFAGSDLDLRTFRFIQRRKIPIKGSFLALYPPAESLTCWKGHAWGLARGQGPFRTLKPATPTAPTVRIGLLPMCWESHEAMNGGKEYQAVPRRTAHSILVWSGYSTVRELECMSGKVIRCITASMPQTGLIAFGRSRHEVFAARPLDTAVRWNRLAQPRKIKHPYLEEIEKPPLEELGTPIKSGDEIAYERGTRAIACQDDRLAIGRDDGSILFGSAGSPRGSSWLSLRKHTEAVRGLAFVPGRPWLVSGARDGSLKLWDVETGKLLRDLAPHEARVNAVVALPEARSASAGPDGIRITDLETGRLVRHIETEGVWVSDLSGNPDGSALVSAMLDGTLRRWDPKTGAEGWRLDAGEGWCATTAFNPKGHVLAAGYELGAITLWDPSNGKRLKRIHVEGTIAWQSGCRSVHSVAWSPGGEVLAAGFGDAVRVYDEQLTSGKGAGWLLPLDWADYYT